MKRFRWRRSTAACGGDESGDEVVVHVDGRPVAGIAGRSLAGTLHLAGIRQLGRNTVSGGARGPFCGMGICFECEVIVDGIPGVRACLVSVTNGMRITTSAEGTTGA